MKNTVKTYGQIVCDLIRINKVRVECFEMLAQESGQSSKELKQIFRLKIEKIQKSNEELSVLIADVDLRDTKPGKIYREWNETKSMLSFKDTRAIFDFCECGEEAALEAYKTALISDSLNSYASRVIMDQKYSLQSSHTQIKKYLDLQQLAY
ncbi:MAG: hypothetical protein ABIS01_05475 [Ferruginibacter sp.]